MKPKATFTPLEIKISDRETLLRNQRSYGVNKTLLTGFTKKDLIVILGCVLFLLANLGAITGGARRRAKEAVCLSNLLKWGDVFRMYANDNGGYFMDGTVSEDSPYWWEGGGGGGMGSWWFIVLQPYYKEQDLRLCPTATKPYDEGGRVPFGAWSTPFGDSGSYGANGYIINTPPGMDFQLGRPTKDNWRTINVRGGGNIPLMLDALWGDGWPEHYDQPAEVENWLVDVIGVDEMRRFCINRHNGFVNGLFLDWSARKIGLKELWTLKWHRGYNVNADPPVWPDWMRNFKNY